jgi:meiotically up-regulated gene 157 (Mug157) protein
MRYDTPVFFQRVQSGKYNAETHNYDDDSIIEVKKYADVIDTDTEHLNLIYGNIKQGSVTVHLQRPYTAAFNYIRIGEKRYRVDVEKRRKCFIASEVQ